MSKRSNSTRGRGRGNLNNQRKRKNVAKVATVTTPVAHTTSTPLNPASSPAPSHSNLPAVSHRSPVGARPTLDQIHGLGSTGRPFTPPHGPPRNTGTSHKVSTPPPTVKSKFRLSGRSIAGIVTGAVVVGGAAYAYKRLKKNTQG